MKRKRKPRPDKRKGPDYARRAKQTPVTLVRPLGLGIFAIIPTIAKPFAGTIIPFYPDGEGSSVIYTDKKGRTKKVRR